ncbi:MAG: hypothetical protein OXF21_00355 [bacterium]|nr:hypothetical protein [bacterium]
MTLIVPAECSIAKLKERAVTSRTLERGYVGGNKYVGGELCNRGGREYIGTGTSGVVVTLGVAGTCVATGLWAVLDAPAANEG